MSPFGQGNGHASQPNTSSLMRISSFKVFLPSLCQTLNAKLLFLPRALIAVHNAREKREFNIHGCHVATTSFVLYFTRCQRHSCLLDVAAFARNASRLVSDFVSFFLFVAGRTLFFFSFSSSFSFVISAFQFRKQVKTINTRTHNNNTNSWQWNEKSNG